MATSTTSSGASASSDRVAATITALSDSLKAPIVSEVSPDHEDASPDAPSKDYPTGFILLNAYRAIFHFPSTFLKTNNS